MERFAAFVAYALSLMMKLLHCYVIDQTDTHNVCNKPIILTWATSPVFTHTQYFGLDSSVTDLVALNRALEGNQLTGSIPPEWGSLHANEVTMASNKLSGDLESQLEPWLSDVCSSTTAFGISNYGVYYSCYLLIGVLRFTFFFCVCELTNYAGPPVQPL